MFSFMDQIFVANQTGVQGIGQKGIDRAFVECFSTTLQAVFCVPFFVAPSAAVDLFHHGEQPNTVSASTRATELFCQNDGIMRMADIVRSGITRSTLYAMRDSGQVE